MSKYGTEKESSSKKTLNDGIDEWLVQKKIDCKRVYLC